MAVIILVRPQMGENIGACARVMKNFGLNEMRIISPRDGWPNVRAFELAAGADDIIEEAKIYENLEDAIQDIECLYATSRQRRDLNKDCIMPQELINHFNFNKKSAFLFGKESSGLSNAELIYAHNLIQIPVDPGFASLNISQAVGIIAYEIYKLKETQVKNIKVETNVTYGEINSMVEDLITRLTFQNYFKVEEKKPQMILNIKNIFSKASLSSQEVKTLRGIIRALNEK